LSFCKNLTSRVKVSDFQVIFIAGILIKLQLARFCVTTLEVKPTWIRMLLGLVILHEA
jgi:hypothetical protein